jgi:hypothetical protein
MFLVYPKFQRASDDERIEIIHHSPFFFVDYPFYQILDAITLPKSIHSVTAQRFELKLALFVTAASIDFLWQQLRLSYDQWSSL